MNGEKKVTSTKLARRTRWTLAAGVVIALGVVSACSSSSSTTPSGAPTSGTLGAFPRTETLYTSGTAYAPPSNWNPFNLGNYATGTQGLIYEPLFLYDPIHNKYKPWLATSGTWSGSTYTISVRNGVKWSDGTALTGADVAYSINLAKTNKSDPYSSNVATVKNVSASGQHRDGHVRQPAWLLAVAGLPVDGPRSCPSTSGPSCPRPTRSPGPTPTRSAPGRCSSYTHNATEVGLQGQPQLVGRQPAGPVVQVQVPG